MLAPTTAPPIAPVETAAAVAAGTTCRRETAEVIALGATASCAVP